MSRQYFSCPHCEKEIGLDVNFDLEVIYRTDMEDEKKPSQSEVSS